MSTQTNATPAPVSKLPRNRDARRKQPGKIEIRNIAGIIEKNGMHTIDSDIPIRTTDEQPSLRQSHAQMVAKLAEYEDQVQQLSEQNRRQVHEIETLRGSSAGLEEGSDHLKARIYELQDQLSKAEVQMADCAAQKDSWKQSYEAEIRAKREETQVKQRLRAENHDLRNDQSQWARLWQIATQKTESQEEIYFRLQQKCESLEQAYDSMCQRYKHRDMQFREHLRSMNSRHDELTAHCSSLAKQSSLRRTYVPIEDEAEVIDTFRQLNVAIRCFCLNVWEELRNEDEEVRFANFPLARKHDVDFTTNDVWLLIACVWELVMAEVFGVGNRGTQPNDLWLETEVAKCVNLLEARITSTQRLNIVHEWRSFTHQCLYNADWMEDSDRIAGVAAEIMQWLLELLGKDDSESTKVQNLMTELVKDVVKPAISFHAMLRKRYSPIYIGTPITVDSAIRTWARSRLNDKQSCMALNVVVVPMLKKLDLDSVTDDQTEVVLLPAETNTLVDQIESATEETAAEDEESEIS